MAEATGTADLIDLVAAALDFAEAEEATEAIVAASDSDVAGVPVAGAGVGVGVSDDTEAADTGAASGCPAFTLAAVAAPARALCCRRRWYCHHRCTLPPPAAGPAHGLSANRLAITGILYGTPRTSALPLLSARLSLGLINSRASASCNASRAIPQNPWPLAQHVRSVQSID